MARLQEEEIQRIIEVAWELHAFGQSAGAFQDQIAAAFLLERWELLPSPYKQEPKEAWRQLSFRWRCHVMMIRRQRMPLLPGFPRLPLNEPEELA